MSWYRAPPFAATPSSRRRRHRGVPPPPAGTVLLGTIFRDNDVTPPGGRGTPCQRALERYTLVSRDRAAQLEADTQHADRTPRCRIHDHAYRDTAGERHIAGAHDGPRLPAATIGARLVTDSISGVRQLPSRMRTSPFGRARTGDHEWRRR